MMSLWLLYTGKPDRKLSKIAYDMQMSFIFLIFLIDHNPGSLKKVATGNLKKFFLSVKKKIQHE